MNAQISKGFTLIEAMIVVAIIGVLAAIAFPSYQSYVIKSKRADMMLEMQNIANNIESEKLAKGSYSTIDLTGLTGDFPRSGTAVYTIGVPSPMIQKWTITATPKGPMLDDGILTLDYQGKKCRTPRGGTQVCGMGDEWRD